MFARVKFILGAVLLSCIAFAQNPFFTSEGGGVWPLRRLKHYYHVRTFPDGYMPPGGAQAAFDAARKMPRFSYGDVQRDLAPDWEFMGPDQTDVGWLARVNALALDPTNPNIIYAGSAKGGLWKSINAGATWTNLTDTLSSQTVGVVELDPQNPQIVWMGTGEEYYNLYTWSGVGVFRSTNGGTTWTQLGATTFAGHRMGDIAISPNNSANVLIGTDAGLYRTTNTGATFSQLIAGRCTGVCYNPTNPNIAYAAMAYQGIFRSSDGGATWTLLSNGIPTTGLDRTEISISRSNPNVLYAVSHNPNGFFLGVWKTVDGGTTWTKLNSAPDGGAAFTWYCIGIEVSPTNPNVVALLGMELYQTRDGGVTWQTISPDHPDMHQAVWYPGSSTQMLLGQDGGLYRSSNMNTSTSWQKLNFGRGTMEYYDHAPHPTNPSIVGAGSQDNGTHFRLNGTTKWTYKVGNDGFRVAWRADDPRYVLSEFQYGYIFLSTDGAENFDFVLYANGNWNTPIYNNPASPNVMFVGGQALFRSLDSGQTWADIGLGFGGEIADIAMRAADPNTLYLGTYTGSVWRSTNIASTTPTYTRVSTGLPAAAIGGLAVDPNNSANVWVVYNRSTGTQVFRSSNSGASWTMSDGNLPNTAVTGITFNPLNSGQVLISTDSGVFVTSNNGTTWSRLGTKLPTEVGISGIAANATTRYLTVSTYGRGVWRIPLPQSISVNGVVNFEGDASTVGHPVTLSFRDPGSTTTLFTRSATVLNGGTFAATSIPNGVYDVAITSAKYLRTTVANVDASLGSVNVGPRLLRVGDIDGDNEVSILDYIALSTAFDTTSTSADLDWDGEVNILDYLLLSNNYGLVGDQ